MEREMREPAAGVCENAEHAVHEDAKRLDTGDHPDTKKPSWKRLLAHVGPGFLVSVAYMDPNNLETDLQAGASYRYELLWVLLIGIIFSLIIQSLAANLGVVTGRHLAELCRSEYPKYLRLCLWLLAEIAVIAVDISEVIGTAFAFNLLFNIDMWHGVLLTGGTTIVLLGLQRYGARKLELLISVMILVVVASFFVQLSMVRPPALEIMRGLFIPKLRGPGATELAIAVIGANVVPHNLFMHSALVLSRKTTGSATAIKEARLFFIMETGFALLVALIVNIVVIAITGTICFSDNLSEEDTQNCKTLTLGSSPFLLKSVLGRASSIVFGVALLASGLSSIITGTYAAQFIMQGFLDIKMKKWKRNLITRGVAMMPSLIVTIVAGARGASRLIIVSSMVIFFVLPYSVIPLLKFSSSSSKMGPYQNSIYVIVISWILGLLTIIISIYFLTTTFIVGWLINGSLRMFAKVLVGIPVFALILAYLGSIVYLTFRKDTIPTLVADSSRFDYQNNARMAGGDLECNDPVPYREDLADIPFPE